MARLMGAPLPSDSGDPFTRTTSVETDQSVWYAVTPPAHQHKSLSPGLLPLPVRPVNCFLEESQHAWE